MKRKLIIPLVVLSVSAIFATGCNNKKNKDLSSKHTESSTVESSAKSNTASKQVQKTNPPETTVKETETSKETSSSVAGGRSLKAKNETYTNANANITYPAISDLKDEKKQDMINKLLAKNVSSVVEAMKIDPSTTKLDITSKIIGYDGRRLSVVYQGTLKNSDGTTKNIFFTNNIDTTSGKDLGLADFADPNTMAGYILSDDVKLSGASEEVTKKFMETRFQRTLEDYVAILSDSDFPLRLDSEGNFISFPQSFSYENNGKIYFTIPVSHELGDFVTIVYSPDTK